MSKKSKTIFGIFAESVGLYFSNIDKFLKYMSFPILGQIAGLGLIFFITYFYSTNIHKLTDRYPNLNNMETLIIISVLIMLPGLAIFCKAFWEYLVAYGALNSMFINLEKSKKVYDFSAHNELITRRTIPFICLWFLFGIFSLIAVIPLFWIICAIFAVYFVLSFQVFTFEPELSPVGCIKKSLQLVRGSFGSTFTLLLLVGLLTYCIVPQIIIVGLDAVGIINSMSDCIIPFVSIFPEYHLEQYGLNTITHSQISSIIIQTVLIQIIIQYTLPLRSILWSNWYCQLSNSTPETDYKTSKTKNKKSSLRPSEKLMKNTRKKYSSAKIDSNIIRRAMEKDDE